ncbi:MAG TPA: hypothetical protein VK277_14385 [Acidimicrobiales bacterium]|nr:hypothetical protein [Acidimicrobiales bacterium]
MNTAAPGRSWRITPRTIQVGLGVVWLFDGLLQLQPHMFGTAFATQVLQPNAAGQPAFVAWPINELAHLVSLQPFAFNAVFAAVQLLVGLGLLMQETVKPALLVSFAWVLGVWVLGEGMGMLLTGMASPLTGAPGAVLLYGLIGLMAWPKRGADQRAPADGQPAAAAGLLGAAGAKVVWAALWTGTGVLWLLPANRGTDSVASTVSGAAAAAPGWLAHAQQWAAHAFAGNGTEVAVVLALVSFVVGIGPLVTSHTTAFLVLGAALSLDYWVLGQSLGGLTTGLATDVNAGPLFVLMAMALFPNRQPVPERAVEVRTPSPIPELARVA